MHQIVLRKMNLVSHFHNRIYSLGMLLIFCFNFGITYSQEKMNVDRLFEQALLAYLGPSNSPEAPEDSRIGQGADLDWNSLFVSNSAILDAFTEGGPWYHYGPGLGIIKKSLMEKYGPANPQFITVVETEEGKAVSDRIEKGEKVLKISTGKNLQYLLDFLKRSMLDIRSLILLTPIFLLYAGFSGCFVGWLRLGRGIRTPYTRKIFHFMIFTMAAILQLTVGYATVVLFGSVVSLAVLYACYRGKGYGFYEAMARPKDAPHRTLFIIVPLVSTALGGVLSNLFFSQSAAAIGYIVAGWGDAVGEPVGTRWGRHKYRVPSLGKVKATRSLEGSAAVCLVGIFVAFWSLLYLGLVPALAILFASLCGIVGSLVEAFSNHGLDNLTIQLAVSATAYFLII